MMISNKHFCPRLVLFDCSRSIARSVACLLWASIIIAGLLWASIIIADRLLGISIARRNDPIASDWLWGRATVSVG